MDRATDPSLLYSGGRVRPGWRLGLFLVLFALFASAGHLAISPLPRPAMQWGSLLVLTLSALLAGWIPLTRLDERSAGALGFPLHAFAVRESALGLGIGGGLIAIAVLLLLGSRSAHFAPDAGTAADYAYFLGWTLLFFAIAAAFEEAVFRGYPFQILVEWIGVWPAIVIASGLFSFLHAQNPNVTPLALANIFLAGVLLSIAYLKTLSLWFVTGVHTGWNWAMAGLFDFPVSGLAFDTPLYTGVPIGRDWWTGGAFGPEAGLVGTIALLAGILAMIRTRALRPADEMLRLNPLPVARLENTRSL